MWQKLMKAAFKEGWTALKMSLAPTRPPPQRFADPTAPRGGEAAGWQGGRVPPEMAEDRAAELEQLRLSAVEAENTALRRRVRYQEKLLSQGTRGQGRPASLPGYGDQIVYWTPEDVNTEARWQRGTGSEWGSSGLGSSLSATSVAARLADLVVVMEVQPEQEEVEALAELQEEAEKQQLQQHQSQPTGGQPPPWQPPGDQQHPWQPPGGQPPPWQPPGDQQQRWQPTGGQLPLWQPPGDQQQPWQPPGGQPPPWQPSGDQQNWQ